MADAIMLSPETYDRLKRLLDDWDNGFEKTLQLGSGLKLEERGTDYLKFGVDPSNIANIGSLLVSDGTNNVSGVTRMNFIGTFFSITSGGVGTANITLKTETCN